MKFSEAMLLREWIVGVLAGIYQPEPDEEIYEWAERTLRIPATENAEMAGMLWSSSLSPYIRELMRWVKRPGKGEFWIRKSSQTGFTMGILIIMCWMIVYRPCPMGYAINSIEEAKKISKVRLQRWILDNQLLSEIGETEESLNNLTYYFRNAIVYMLSAATTGDWQNKAIELMFMDELDLHEEHEGQGTTVDMARGRVKKSPNSKIIGFSTPGATDQITIQYKSGTMDEIRFPFPCCGHVQAMKKENLVFSTREFKDLAGGYDMAKVKSDAHFKCQLCGAKFFDHQKRAAMQDCEYVATNPKADPDIRSVQIWDAYSPFVTFGQIATMWIAAEGNLELLEGLYRRNFGEPFERQGSVLKHNDVLACRGKDDEKTGEKTFYLRGQCPFIPTWLTQVTDVQGDIRKTMKIAVDAKGNFWVIDWRVTLSITEAFDWIDEPIIGPGGEPLLCSEGFCDEGHLASEIRRECHERITLDSLRCIWPLKGVKSVDNVAELVSSNLRFVGGVYGEEQIRVYAIADRAFKWELFNMIRHRTKRQKSGKPIIYIPSDSDDEAPEHDNIVDELSNEHPYDKKVKGTMRTIQDWKKTGHNDYLDTLKYCIGMWTVKRGLLRSAAALEVATA
jgi:phage terminase large subunit GpA-like protein